MTICKRVGPSAALHSFTVQCKESSFVLSSGNSLQRFLGDSGAVAALAEASPQKALETGEVTDLAAWPPLSNSRNCSKSSSHKTFVCSETALAVALFISKVQATCSEARGQE